MSWIKFKSWTTKKKFIRNIAPYKNLYRDDKSGIAWIEDGSSGNCVSVHSNIDKSGSVKGMKNSGYWRKTYRTIRSHGYIYNIDSFICNQNDEMEMIISNECMCQGCIERRENKMI